MTARVCMAPGPILWKLVLREKGQDPVQAMRLLREAGASAKTRAKMAVETWGQDTPKVGAALLTLRSAEALRWALEALGWDERTSDPEGTIARLRRLAGVERQDSTSHEPF